MHGLGDLTSPSADSAGPWRPLWMAGGSASDSSRRSALALWYRCVRERGLVGRGLKLTYQISGVLNRRDGAITRAFRENGC